MAETTEKDKPANEPKAPAAKGVTEKQVNDVVAEATLAVEQRLTAMVQEEIAALGTRFDEGLATVSESIVKTLEEKGGGAAGELSAEVNRELHYLRGLVENVATTVERSIGQRVNRKVSPLSLEDAGAVAAPSVADNPAPPSGEGPDTAGTLLG